MHHGKGRKGRSSAGWTGGRRPTTSLLREVATRSEKASGWSFTSDASRGIVCVCGASTERSADIRFNGFVTGGWKCAACGEEYGDPEKTEQTLVLNRLRQHSKTLKLNKVRSNLVMRIPVEVSEVFGLQDGDSVELRIVGDDIVLRTAKPPLAWMRRKAA